MEPILKKRWDQFQLHGEDGLAIEGWFKGMVSQACQADDILARFYTSDAPIGVIHQRVRRHLRRIVEMHHELLEHLDRIGWNPRKEEV